MKVAVTSREAWIASTSEMACIASEKMDALMNADKGKGISCH